jgi:hypothetical protein
MTLTCAKFIEESFAAVDSGHIDRYLRKVREVPAGAICEFKNRGWAIILSNVELSVASYSSKGELCLIWKCRLVSRRGVGEV